MQYKVNSYDGIPYTTTTNATIYPLAHGEHTGVLKATDKEYDVYITREINAKRGVVERVWARVSLGAAREGIDECAMRIANRAVHDPSFKYLATNLANGETIFTKTWTHSFPDTAEMDEFFAEVITFIESNADFMTEMFV